MSQVPVVKLPRNLQWCNTLPRLALLNEFLTFVGAISMHATGVLGKLNTAEPGLLFQLVWMHCIGLWGLCLNASLALWVVRRAWRRLPDPTAHYDQHGVYTGLPGRGLAALALATVLGVLVSSWLARQTLGLLLPWLSTIGPAPLPPYELSAFNTLYGTAAVYTFEYFRDRTIWNKHRARLASKMSAQARLDMLRAQLEPHMLFNTLANVSDLIDEDPPQAKAMLLRLISFLRVTLSGSRAPQHALASEFQLASDYLALMQIRMGARLQTELHLPPELADMPVPALLLQPLVENAIQHGLAPRRAGGILQVRAATQGPHLVLTVRNSGSQPAQGSTGTGFGLAFVAERLQALYGEGATLTLQHLQGDDLTEVTVRVPLASCVPVAAPHAA